MRNDRRGTLSKYGWRRPLQAAPTPNALAHRETPRSPIDPRRSRAESHNSTNRRQTAETWIHEARTLGCGTFTRRSETSLEIVDHPEFTFENSRARSRTGFLGTDSSYCSGRK